MVAIDTVIAGANALVLLRRPAAGLAFRLQDVNGVFGLVNKNDQSLFRYLSADDHFKSVNGAGTKAVCVSADGVVKIIRSRLASSRASCRESARQLLAGLAPVFTSRLQRNLRKGVVELRLLISCMFIHFLLFAECAAIDLTSPTRALTARRPRRPNIKSATCSDSTSRERRREASQQRGKAHKSSKRGMAVDSTDGVRFDFKVKVVRA